MKRKLAIVLALAFLMVNVVAVIAYAADFPSEGWFDFVLNDRSGTKASYRYSNYAIRKETNASKGAVKLTSASPAPTKSIRTIFVNSGKTAQTSDTQYYTYGGKSVKPAFTTSKAKGYDHYTAMRLNTNEGQSRVSCVGSFTLDYVT